MKYGTTPRLPGYHPRPSRSRTRRTGLAVTGLVSLVLVTCACGSGSAGAAAPATTTAGPSVTSGADAPNTGAGPVTRAGASAGSGSSGNESTGSYSVAFARCMRAHGVPAFPNPNGSAVPAGVDQASAAYQAALHGPCESLAPAGWVSSGSGPVAR
jgi:hypothetical protein